MSGSESSSQDAGARSSMTVEDRKTVFRCDTCDATYSRRGHLRRHQARREYHIYKGYLISWLKDYQIPVREITNAFSATESLVAGKSEPKFSRECTDDINRDIVRRHYATCASRGSHAVPGYKKRGQQPKACDPCARSKIACDAELPCEVSTITKMMAVISAIFTDNQIELHSERRKMLL
jgi:hypothetical protein